jgi:ABC-type glycerol-3-phosphate transport system substrate-binding protein
MKAFQIILLGFFVALAIAGLVAFAMFRGGSQQASNIVVWGMVPSESIDKILGELRSSRNGAVNMNYVFKDPAVFDNELLNAIASGRSPDAVILPNDLIYRYSDKIIPVPYSSISESDFRNTYVDMASVYLTSSGILALPISVDPLIMYWNRDIFNTTGKTNPPAYWDELQAMVPDFVVKNASKDILRSGVAFGEFRNVTHPKELLTLLMMQAGSRMVENNADYYTANLDESGTGSGVYPASAAFRYYTDFADPNKVVYSWNRSLKNDKQTFIAGDLAVYFGLASEYSEIAAKNPNLNFGISSVPQKRDARIFITDGLMNGFSILKGSVDPANALTQITKILAPDVLQYWVDYGNIIPARRDMLSTSNTDKVLKVLSYRSALSAKTWMDPDGQETDKIFQQAIESISTGKKYVYEAIADLNGGINLLLAKYKK